MTYQGYKYEYIPHKQIVIRDLARKQTVKVWDIAQYYHSSLDRAAEKYLGERKIEMETKTFSREYVEEHWDELVRYCLRDAQLTEKLADLLARKVQDWKIPVNSLLSTAYLSSVHFTTFCKVPILGDIWDQDLRAVEIAYHSYAGGMFQAFKRGSFPYLYEYDINSAYPFEIANLVNIRYARIIYSNKYRHSATYGFITCRITIREPVIHPIPLKKASLNFYPIGTFYKTITKNEYEFLIRKGADVEIIDGVWLFCKDPEDKPFKNEIYRLYGLKDKMKEEIKNKTDQADEMGYMLIKIILNSLYGKMWQLTRVHTREAPDFLRAGALFNPFYASVITANTRLKVCEIADLYPENIVAVATDSVMLDREIPLQTSDALGDFDKAGEGPGLVIGSGIYSIGKKNKFRGFDIERVTLRDLVEQNAQKSKIPIPAVRPLTWGEVAFRGMDHELINRFTDQTKQLDINFDKKRAWTRELKTAGDLLELTVDSVPLIMFE